MKISHMILSPPQTATYYPLLNLKVSHETLMWYIFHINVIFLTSLLRIHYSTSQFISVIPFLPSVFLLISLIFSYILSLTFLLYHVISCFLMLERLNIWGLNARTGYKDWMKWQHVRTGYKDWIKRLNLGTGYKDGLKEWM